MTSSPSSAPRIYPPAELPERLANEIIRLEQALRNTEQELLLMTESTGDMRAILSDLFFGISIFEPKRKILLELEQKASLQVGQILDAIRKYEAQILSGSSPSLPITSGWIPVEQVKAEEARFPALNDMLDPRLGLAFSISDYSPDGKKAILFGRQNIDNR